MAKYIYICTLYKACTTDIDIERQILRYILKYLVFQPFSQLIPHQLLVPFKTFGQSERRHNLTNQKTTFVLQPLSELIPYSTLLCFPPLHCCCSAGGNLELGRAPGPMRILQPRLLNQSPASREIDCYCCSLLFLLKPFAEKS